MGKTAKVEAAARNLSQAASTDGTSLLDHPDVFKGTLPFLPQRASKRRIDELETQLRENKLTLSQFPAELQKLQKPSEVRDLAWNYLRTDTLINGLDEVARAAGYFGVTNKDFGNVHITRASRRGEDITITENYEDTVTTLRILVDRRILGGRRQEITITTTDTLSAEAREKFLHLQMARREVMVLAVEDKSGERVKVDVKVKLAQLRETYGSQVDELWSSMESIKLADLINQLKDPAGEVLRLQQQDEAKEFATKAKVIKFTARRDSIVVHKKKRGDLETTTTVSKKQLAA